jgi:hypothetical protein
MLCICIYVCKLVVGSKAMKTCSSVDHSGNAVEVGHVRICMGLVKLTRVIVFFCTQLRLILFVYWSSPLLFNKLLIIMKVIPGTVCWSN